MMPNDGNLKSTVDLNDPDYLLEARIFNAITRHPRIQLYFSNRNKLTKRVIAFLWEEADKINAEVAERERDYMREIEIAVRDDE